MNFNLPFKLFKMAYLTPTDFYAKHSSRSQYSSGAYGTIFFSEKSKKLIKRQDSLTHFFRELIFLTNLNHKYIISIEDYTLVDNTFGYFSMEKCQPIHRALKKGWISYRDVIIQLINAVAYLHFNQICHGDIKPANIVYSEIDDCIKLIDFGLTSLGPMMSGIAFTDIFRDPEYFFNYDSPLKVELYSIPFTIYYILLNRYYTIDEHPYYLDKQDFIELGFTDQEMLIILEECQKPLDIRLNAWELLEFRGMESIQVNLKIKSIPILGYIEEFEPVNGKVKTLLKTAELLAMGINLSYHYCYILANTLFPKEETEILNPAPVIIKTFESLKGKFLNPIHIEVKSTKPSPKELYNLFLKYASVETAVRFLINVEDHNVYLIDDMLELIKTNCQAHHTQGLINRIKF